MKSELQTCSMCGTALRAERITYTQTIGDALYVVTDVPAQVCQGDGEQYLAPDVVDALQELIDRGTEPTKTIQVPVYRFSQKSA